MKPLLSIVVLLCLIVCQGNAQVNHSTHHGLPESNSSSSRSVLDFNYDFDASVSTYIELNPALAEPVNNGEIWDQPEYTIPMGFPFELNGHAVTSFHFDGSGSRMASNTQVPFVVAQVFPFESDLIDRGTIGGTSLSPISYIIEGVPGSRIQKIEFKNAGSYYEYDVQGTLNMYVNFQCWLFEGSNNIEFHFGPNHVDIPILFYGGGTGPLSGLRDYDEFLNQVSNGHYLIGSPSNPFMSEDIGFINGTPATGTVYHFTYLPPLNITVTGVNNTSYCQPNGSAQVVATGGTTPYTYSWSTGDNTTSIDSLDAGIYTVTVTDDEGSTATGSVTIESVAPMTLTVVSTNETGIAANDGTATANPLGGASPYTYLWSNGATTASITGLAPGTYGVTVTDASGCTETGSATINSFSCPTLVIEATVTNASCFGSCNGSIHIVQITPGSGPFGYEWSNGSTNSEILNLCEGVYIVTVTDINACTAVETFQITQPDTLIVNAGATNESLPNGNNGTAWAATTGGTLPYAYAWNNGSTDSLITNLSPGFYTVNVTDANGCIGNDTVVINAFCTGLIESSIVSTNCLDSCQWNISASFSGGNGGPYTYEWSTGDTAVATLDSLCPGIYSLTITDQSNQCVYLNGNLIVQPEAIVAEVDTIIHLTDSSTTTIAISVISGPGPYFFNWFGPNGFVGSEEDLTGVPPGMYSLEIYNGLGNCGGIDSIEILDMTTGITPIRDWNLLVFPNPANDFVYLRGIEAEEFSIQLFNADGRELRSWNNKISLDVDDVQPGWYVLKITAEKNSVSQPLYILR